MPTEHIHDNKSFYPNASKIINLQLLNANIDMLESNLIKDLSLKNFGIFGCKIGSVEENALTNIKIYQGFYMENSTFQNIQSKAFNVNVVGQHKNGAALVKLLDVRFEFLHSLAFHEVTTASTGGLIILGNVTIDNYTSGALMLDESWKTIIRSIQPYNPKPYVLVKKDCKCDMGNLIEAHSSLHEHPEEENDHHSILEGLHCHYNDTDDYSWLSFEKKEGCDGFHLNKKVS